MSVNFCPNCGERIKVEANFCSNCGYKIAELKKASSDIQSEAKQREPKSVLQSFHLQPLISLLKQRK